MNNLKIFSYNQGSQGAKELAQTLGIRRLKHEGSRWKGGPGTAVINWGSAKPLEYLRGTRVYNDPRLVGQAANKKLFFERMAASNEDVRVPEWTCDPRVAQDFLDKGHIVVARTVLNGHSGEGIIICEPGGALAKAPLYTKYVKKEKEFRVHCAFGRVIDLQRKIKRPDFEGEPNWRVRNHQNGFIYVRNDVVAPEDVTHQALQAFKASGLDFGAIDVLWNLHEGKAYVLEINTAPGLQGQTVTSYADAFRDVL